LARVARARADMEEARRGLEEALPQLDGHGECLELREISAGQNGAYVSHFRAATSQRLPAKSAP
jgi:hypothetical protein